MSRTSVQMGQEVLYIVFTDSTNIIAGPIPWNYSSSFAECPEEDLARWGLSAVRKPSAVGVLPRANREHDNFAGARCVDDAMRTAEARAALPIQTTQELLAQLWLAVKPPYELARLVGKLSGEPIKILLGPGRQFGQCRLSRAPPGCLRLGHPRLRQEQPSSQGRKGY